MSSCALHCSLRQLFTAPWKTLHRVSHSEEGRANAGWHAFFGRTRMPAARPGRDITQLLLILKLPRSHLLRAKSALGQPERHKPQGTCHFKRGMHQSELCLSQANAQLSTEVGSQANATQE